VEGNSNETEIRAPGPIATIPKAISNFRSADGLLANQKNPHVWALKTVPE